MKITIAFLSLMLAVGSACSSSVANVNVSQPNIAANTNTNAEPTGTPASAAAESQTVAAESLVADLYKQHDAKKSPFFQTKSRALVDKYFTKGIGDLIWKDASGPKGEVGVIDGDPLYAAQDTEIKNFAVGKAIVKGDSASVPVTFTNYGNKVTITFLLKQVESSWKIDDISYGEGDTLRSWFKTSDTNGSSVPSGEFEGKYQVGDTFCTVKQAKMSFEIRWAKGSGVEMFFAQGTNTFETERNKEGGTNSFVFDDDKYEKGLFYRTDGRVLTVRKVK